MSIFEFNEEKEWEKIRKAEHQYGIERGIEIGTERGIEIGTERGIEIGTERGIEIGTKRHLVQLICKKLLKGKIPEIIKEELEEDMDKIKIICEAAKKYAPDYNEEEILKELDLLKHN